MEGMLKNYISIRVNCIDHTRLSGDQRNQSQVPHT